MKQRKLLRIILCLILLSGITACGRGDGETQKESHSDFLIEKDWQYNTLSCTEVLHFRKDGGFSYYETCGNPVGNSDCYETYSYDVEAGIITAHGYDDSVEDMEIEVLRYTEDSLLVRIEGAIKEFYVDVEVPSLITDRYEEVEGYSAYLAIGDMDNGMIETAPANVDMDAGGRDLVREEKLAENVVFYNLYEELIHPDGEKPDEMSSEFTELTMDDVAQSVDNSFSYGYIWYNDDLEIEKIVYYGANEIWE